MKERKLNDVCASQSQSIVDISGTSHVSYPVIKIYKLAKQTGSHTPNHTRKEYGSKHFT